jgi:carbonic anhydrase
MRHFAAILICASVSTSVACAPQRTPEPDEAGAHAHWSYQGETAPEHWAEIEKDSDCDGRSQSPVNIVAINARAVGDAGELEIHYPSVTRLHDVRNNGHSIQFDFSHGDHIRYRGHEYDLKQIHFHEPAEHLLNGVRYPIEIHLVHQREDGSLAVIAIFGEEGAESRLFEFFESYLPIEVGQTKPLDLPVDLTSLLPHDTSYFSYSGSLTTPPCTGGVRWFVVRQPIAVSLESVLLLRQNMPLNNYRDEQALNGRVVTLDAAGAVVPRP